MGSAPDLSAGSGSAAGWLQLCCAQFPAWQRWPSAQSLSIAQSAKQAPLGAQNWPAGQPEVAQREGGATAVAWHRKSSASEVVVSARQRCVPSLTWLRQVSGDSSAKPSASLS